NFMSAGGTFGLGHAPALRGGPDEHEPCGGAGFAQRCKGAADRVRAVGVLVAVFFIADGLHDFYAIPVGVQFVGDDAGKSSLAAAAHFGAMSDGVDSAVSVDREIDARRERTCERDVGDAMGSAGSCAGESFGGEGGGGEDASTPHDP